MPRDLPPRAEPGRASGITGAKPRSDGREDTEALQLSADWRAEPDDQGEVDPPELSARPMGTRDRPPTRLESPIARRPPSAARHPPPAMASERPEDRIGTMLGAYRLHALIGKGGMGFVYRAEHARLGRDVALKLLRADYAQRRESVSRFFQEARTVNRIRHRNIVDVTDFVELDDGTTFIIMELLRGQSLGSWARHSFDSTRALGLLIQICDGLAAAHAVGVIHRDLKPDNVVVMKTPDGAEMIKLLDFGVAKLLNRDDEDVGLETAAGSVIGTPAYMSPEQAGGLTVDARADIYSLGAIMYELFCGQPLFRGRSFGEYVRKHLNEAPVPPRQTPRGGDLDPRLEHAVLRCLEKDPARRFAAVEDLRLELLEILGSLEVVERPPATHPSGRSDGAALPPPHRTGSTTLPPAVRTTGDRAAGATGAQPLAGSFPGAQPAPAPTPYPGAVVSLGGSYGGSLGGSYGGSLGGLQGSVALRPRRWAWTAAGAAVLIGIAVGGALLASGREHTPVAKALPAPPPVVDPAATPPAPPEVTAVEPEVPPTKPSPPRADGVEPVAPSAGATDQPIAVRIDAPAGARVLQADGEVVICVAPCSLSIDPTDGGSERQREYVVRLEGFADQVVAIDLTAPPPAIAVAFTDKGPAPDDRDRPGPGKRRRPGASTVTPPTGPTVTPPVEPPPIKKPHTTVDPTETIDPFATK